MKNMYKSIDVDIKTIERVKPFFADEWAVRSAAYHMYSANDKLLKSLLAYGGIDCNDD